MNYVHSQDPEDRVLQMVWGRTSAPARGPRARYGVDDVAAAAVSLADAGGLSAVALSAVAADLGLTTTALYRYVDSKETLIELMVDAALGPAPPPGAGAWSAGVESWVFALWARYRDHPWAAEVRLSGMPRYPQRLGWLDALLCLLDRGSVGEPMQTALLLDALTRSFALLARASSRQAPPTWLLEEVAARYPWVGKELQRDWTNIEDEITTAVRTVLLATDRLSRADQS